MRSRRERGGQPRAVRTRQQISAVILTSFAGKTSGPVDEPRRL